MLAPRGTTRHAGVNKLQCTEHDQKALPVKCLGGLIDALNCHVMQLNPDENFKMLYSHPGRPAARNCSNKGALTLFSPVALTSRRCHVRNTPCI